MANYEFKKDIVDGELGEEIVVKDLESKGSRFLNNNKDNKYDVKMAMPNGNNATFEIKTDVWCIPPQEVTLPSGMKVSIRGRDNSNMFIEFECRGKESGIKVTKADYFVTYFPYYKEIWYIKMDKLKSLINSEDFLTSEQSGDDGSNTKGYLIPRNDYKEHFKIRKVEFEWPN